MREILRLQIQGFDRIDTYGRMRERTVAKNVATIRRILSQSEVQALMGSYRDQALELVPRALESINRRFDQRKATEWLMVEILKGVKVFMRKTETDVHHIVDELQQMTDDELKDYINERVNKVAASTPGNA